MNRATKSDSWVRNPDGTFGFTANIITGCLNGCDYCFARGLANGRLKPRYLANENLAPLYAGGKNIAWDQRIANPFYPRFWPSVLKQIKDRKKPAGIFLDIMGEWAGDWVPREWQLAMFKTIEDCPQDIFYLLTKQPQNLPKFSPFPDNCRVGVSATADGDMTNAYYGLSGIEANGKFISVEPLLGAISMKSHRILEVVDQVITGAMTCGGGDLARLTAAYPQLAPMPYGRRYTLQPRAEWVKEIVTACDAAGAKVFLKDNLSPLLHDNWPNQPWAFADGYYTSEEHPDIDRHLRQEIPAKIASGQKEGVFVPE